MTNQRMKWDAEATFKSLNAQGKRRQASIDDERLKTTPYTPPPNVAAWLQAQADKPKGRDYDAILRAAKKPPVGYYEDAPRGIRFGGQPLPSAGHGKDVDTADGPWPKWVLARGGVGVFRWDAKDSATFFSDAGGVPWPATRGDFDGGLVNQGRKLISQPVALQWLEQNGHADAAAQLRGKPRADVATGGGRVWRSVYGTVRTEVGGDHFLKNLAWAVSPYAPDAHHLEVNEYTELFGPERDAILAECRKAMGI